MNIILILFIIFLFGFEYKKINNYFSYDSNGNQIQEIKIVKSRNTFDTSGVRTITLTGNSVFSDINSYECYLTNNASASSFAVGVTYISGSQMKFWGLASQPFSWLCIGY